MFLMFRKKTERKTMKSYHDLYSKCDDFHFLKKVREAKFLIFLLDTLKTTISI